MSRILKNLQHVRQGMVGMLLLLIFVFTWPGVGLAQLDICGCIGNPDNLGAFDSADDATYPPGTTLSGSTVWIPLPPDGILIFESFTVRSPHIVRFARNEANTPVTILVTGDVVIESNASINVNGSNGGYASQGLNGQGGLGGPGGFRGGDGAYQMVNFATLGGNGLGPGGGNGGTGARQYGGYGGRFVGVPELLPLVGGSGGGGGASTEYADTCSSGGGGGGGGAILIAANGAITVNGTISAKGGQGGAWYYTNCSSCGGGGSGGAIRLVGDTITGAGALHANGGPGIGSWPRPGSPGAIRMEAFANTMSPTHTSPPAYRAPAPGPLVNPLMATVAITAVAGEAILGPPQGVFGDVDVIVPVQGPTTIELETSGVPIGTAVDVTIKPRVGAGPFVETVTLDPALDPVTCSAEGDCTALVTVDLPAGAHTLEAQATFQTP